MRRMRQSYRQEDTHESRHGSPTPSREGHHGAAAGSGRVLSLHLGDSHPIPVAPQHEQPCKKADSGHGHVHPRADGQRARCGDPGMCDQCSREQALANVWGDQRRH